jgi:hypothetical protein
VLSGRAVGIERRAVDRRFVLLPPHRAHPFYPAVCLPAGIRYVVRRVELSRN